MSSNYIKMKTCTKCKTEKPLSEFHKTSRKAFLKNGVEKIYNYHHSKCKACRCREKNIYYRKYTIKNYDEKFSLLLITKLIIKTILINYKNFTDLDLDKNKIIKYINEMKIKKLDKNFGYIELTNAEYYIIYSKLEKLLIRIKKIIN